MRQLLFSALLATLVVPVTTPSTHADQVRLDVSATHPTMMAGEKQINHLRIALTGFEMASALDRPPVNVAIVLDKSGSMNGDKIEQAKRAAIDAIGRLDDHDIVSVVLYDDQVNVLVPATKASDREAIIRAVQGVTAQGGTALFAGVSKGAMEVKKFKQDNMVNRVILLSDGKANVGPSSTAELAALGESLLKDGVSVTTMGLGLGYNEDLMTSLAAASNGNHAFIENAADTLTVFNNEFDDILSVVAKDFIIQVDIDPSTRPVRVIGNSADIEGQRVTLPLAQLYSGQTRDFVLEVEVKPGEAGSSRPLANVSIKYRNMQTETIDQLASTIALRFTNDSELVREDINADALAFCTLQLTTERNREATILRDRGQVEEAKQMLEKNSLSLLECRRQCEDQLSGSALRAIDLGITVNQSQAEVIADPEKWNFNRKSMRQYQNQVQQQQTYNGRGKIDASESGAAAPTTSSSPR